MFYVVLLKHAPQNYSKGFNLKNLEVEAGGVCKTDKTFPVGIYCKTPLISQNSKLVS